MSTYLVKRLVAGLLLADVDLVQVAGNVEGFLKLRSVQERREEFLTSLNRNK
jgi:hypothetical protein